MKEESSVRTGRGKEESHFRPGEQQKETLGAWNKINTPNSENTDTERRAINTYFYYTKLCIKSQPSCLPRRENKNCTLQ